MTLMRDVVVLCLGAEVPGLRKAGIAEQIQRPVDGGESKMRVGLSELMIHGFGGNVFLPEKRGQNHFPLAREFELMLAKMLLERIHFFNANLPDPMRNASDRWLIKNENALFGQGGVH